MVFPDIPKTADAIVADQVGNDDLFFNASVETVNVFSKKRSIEMMKDSRQYSTPTTRTGT